MNYRHLLLISALALACDGIDSSSSSSSLVDNTGGTFAPIPVADTPPAVADTPIALVNPEGIEDTPPEPDAPQTAQMKADGLKAQGKIAEAAEAYRSIGMDEEAYKLYAPEDFKLEDQTKYNGAPDAKLAAAVDERPSTMRHKMTLNKETFWLTASAGHLTAFAKNPQKEDPQASIFYTAYTRDDLPKEERPVTFFFNGGPGASSIYLHLASFAPKRAFIDGPKVKPEWAKEPPDSFPMIDDAESLIDKSDLVFIDIVPGSGFSQAIAPKVNKDFWDTTIDVALSRQFITRYINVNHRQASPKYLYGESYGGGIRVPKLARAMEEAGTGGYEPNPEGGKPKVLTGVVFHSPAFDYSANKSKATLPTIAMVADYLKKTKTRGTRSLDQYAQVLRDFMVDKYQPALSSLKPIDISKYTGSSYESLSALVYNVEFNGYDARMYVPIETKVVGLFAGRLNPWYDFNYFEERALNNIITSYLPEYVNYKSASSYINASLNNWAHPSNGAYEGWKRSLEPKNGLPDIVATLQLHPSLKLLTLHGYYDTVTTFYRSELDLKGVVLDPVKKTTLLDRVPVKNFAGGHMIYYSEEARAPLKKTLAEFYDAPPYGTGPTVAKAEELAPPIRSTSAAIPATAISMH